MREADLGEGQERVNKTCARCARNQLSGVEDGSGASASMSVCRRGEAQVAVCSRAAGRGRGDEDDVSEQSGVSQHVK